MPLNFYDNELFVEAGKERPRLDGSLTEPVKYAIDAETGTPVRVFANQLGPMALSASGHAVPVEKAE